MPASGLLVSPLGRDPGSPTEAKLSGASTCSSYNFGCRRSQRYPQVGLNLRPLVQVKRGAKGDDGRRTGATNSDNILNRFTRSDNETRRGGI